MDATDDLEDPVARAAWSAADRLFHRRLAALTENAVLLALADHVATLMDQPLWQRLRDEAIAGAGGVRVRLHAAEHRLIYDAILDGDGDAAAFQAARHLRRVRRDMTLE
jgi:DNA-binding FadR family transcriptional regulator